MKIAIDTFSYYMHFGKHWYVPEKPVDIKWYCHKSLELGVNGLHIDPYHINLDQDVGWVRDFASKNDMYIELGACGTSLVELKPSIDTAKVLGADLLRTFVGGDCLEGRTVTAARATEAKENLKTTLPYAENYGVKIAIENHGDIYMEDMLSILELDSDYLGVCYDSGNYAFTGEDPLDGLKAFENRILCTHLKDVCRVDIFPKAKPFETVNEPVHFCALGEGYLPMDKIINGLVGLGIENFTIEICSACDKSMTEKELLAFEDNNVLKSIKYLKNNNLRQI